ncbi:MAG: hypothetical protein NWP87_02055, partial [Winogradskyella sp.]|nr:hypothetical protein [Winogradskyella sp.]
CIPILQDIYAKMMPIPLEDGLNCIIYNNLEDVEKLSYRLERLSDAFIANLHKGVCTYFDSYLTSEAITKQLLSQEAEVFYLQAEGFSINLYEGE